MMQTETRIAPSPIGLVHDYLAMWNEADQAARRELIAASWTPEAEYVDPHFSVQGYDGLDEMVGALQAQVPGHAFRLVGEPDAHHDRMRWVWELVSTDTGTVAASGTDFAVLAADGRLAQVTGFLNATAQQVGGAA